MSRITARRAVLGACVAALGLVAGCAGQDAAPGGWTAMGKAVVDVARGAPDATRAAGTARFAMEMTYDSTGGPLGDTMFTSSGTGTYDFARQIGEGEFSDSDGLLPPQEVVFRNNVLYQRDVGESRWQKLDYSEIVNTPIGQHDPSRQLDLLRGVSDEVRELGTAEVRGTEVQRYAITIDPQRLAETTEVVVDGTLVQDALRSIGPIPGEVFVDADGRVRRFQVEIETSGADIASSPEFSEMFGNDPEVQEMLSKTRTVAHLSIDYFDFGLPVTAQEPDPSMVDSGH